MGYKEMADLKKFAEELVNLTVKEANELATTGFGSASSAQTD